MNLGDGAFPGQSPEDYWRRIAANSGMDFVDPLPESQMEALSLMSRADAVNFKCIPISLTSDQCTIAISDPMNFEVIDSLSFLLKPEVNFIAGLPSAIDAAIQRSYKET